MKRITTCLTVIIFFLIVSCQYKESKVYTLPDVEKAFNEGQFTIAEHWADSLIKAKGTDSLTKGKLSTIIDLSERIKYDFNLTEPEVETRLKKEFGEYSQNDKNQWEKNNWLEYRMIDGEKRYFKRAVSNLRLILNKRGPNLKNPSELIPSKKSLFYLKNSRKVIKNSKPDGKPVLPVNIKVSYQLSVKADAVPDGETIRCWLPYPRENHERQREVKLIKTVPEKHFMAPDTLLQRSVFMEQPAVKGKPTIFEIEFSYQPMAQYFDLAKQNILPYDTSSTIYKRYTGEQTPHIVFTRKIRQLSDSLVRDATNPAEKVKKLYYWINDHIIWTGALEYSIMPDIPGYVLTNLRGDCGMQTLLFMSMARCQGIPVKWQSGWNMCPERANLHDWCEVYYQGVGWVPLDMSFNLQPSTDLREKEFYISGIDAYRMIVNDGIGETFVPAKKFPRSEPYDFQRGEVEWPKGNLYFNQWDYNMKVDYSNN